MHQRRTTCCGPIFVVKRFIGDKNSSKTLSTIWRQCTIETTVYEWIEKFKTGRTSVKHFKSQLSAGKVMLTIFWDSKGPILEDFLEKGSTINSASYCDLLANRLKPANQTPRMSKKVLLQHDNARPHVAKATIETINKLGFEVLEHPAYSPDLAPSDYHLFAPLALRGRKFSSDESVQKAVHQWLCDQPKTFFSDGIYKLVDRWNKCIEMGGDYVEK